MKDILQEYGISFQQLKKILASKKPKPKVLKMHITDEEYRFGVVADTHFCSIHEKLNELHTFYEIMRKVGVKTIFHAGDLVAGWKIYRGQENEVHTFGARNQAKYVIEHYPKIKGITTYFITGNHDLAWWNLAGTDIGETISDQREDMIYLGQCFADTSFNGIRVRLMHPDGWAYAISYKSQKIAEQIPSGQKPQILLFGHWHTQFYYMYRNMHIMNAGCFEGQSLFLLRKGINPTIGGWDVRIRVADDKKKSVVAFTPTWIPFFT